MLGSAVGPYLETAASSIGVLRNGTVTYPQFGIPIIYGDYYLLEALLKWNALPVSSSVNIGLRHSRTYLMRVIQF